MRGGAMRGRGSRRSVVFGGLRGEMSYVDNSFDDLDPDIQRMFYESRVPNSSLPTACSWASAMTSSSTRRSRPLPHRRGL